jgi:hypothetical protein
MVGTNKAKTIINTIIIIFLIHIAHESNIGKIKSNTWYIIRPVHIKILSVADYVGVGEFWELEFGAEVVYFGYGQGALVGGVVEAGG